MRKAVHREMRGFFLGGLMGERYDDLTALLERFDWLADSLVHSVTLEGDLRYDIRATLLIRAIDGQDGFAEKTLKLVLSDVAAFRLEQAGGFAAFETSQGVGIARDGARLFLDLAGPEGTWNAVPADFQWRALPRHISVAEISQRRFYLSFADFSAEILPAAAGRGDA